MYSRKKINRGFRSGLEVMVKDQLLSNNVVVKYEPIKIEWEDLAYRKYTPDFLLPNGIIIETKGLFTAQDRRKHILIKKQHPELDIRFVFTNCRSKLSKKSKSTYASWCEKHNFLYSTKKIPIEWLNEKEQIKIKQTFIPFKGKKLC